MRSVTFGGYIKIQVSISMLICTGVFHPEIIGFVEFTGDWSKQVTGEKVTACKKPSRDFTVQRRFQNY